MKKITIFIMLLLFSLVNCKKKENDNTPLAGFLAYLGSSRTASATATGTSTETPQWQADFLWHQIPANAAAARFEISTLPFPYTVENDFSGIIECKTNSTTSY